MRKELTRHKGICLEAFVACERCQTVYKRKDEQAHVSVCPEQLITCPQCKSELRRKDRETHECILELVRVIEELKVQSNAIGDDIRELQHANVKKSEVSKQFNRICMKIGHDFQETKLRECKPNDMLCLICGEFKPGNDTHNFKQDRYKG